MKTALMVSGLALLLAAPAAMGQTAPAGAQDGGSEALRMLTRPGEVAAQLRGEYGEFVKSRLPAGRVDHAWAKAAPGEATGFVDYGRAGEVKVRVRMDAHTTVVFPEPLVRADTGNKKIIQPEIPGEAHHLLFLWPQQHGADTSVTAITKSGKVYLIYAQVIDVGAEAVPDAVVQVVEGGHSVTAPGAAVDRLPLAPGAGGAPSAPVAASRGGPGQEAAVSDGVVPPEWLASTEFDAEALTMQFEMTGDSTIMPEKVISDGKFTWLYYGERIDQGIPTVAMVKDGSDAPVHYRRRGQVIEVLAPVGEGLTLRDNQKTACIKATGGFAQTAAVGAPDA